MEIILAILTGLMKLVYFIAHPILVFYSKGKKQTVPPITNKLLFYSATDLAEKIRKKEISSVEICKAYINRIKEVNPVINAVVEERFDDAIKDAKKVDDYLSKTSFCKEELEKIKPLLGVPFTVKESCSVEGMSYCVGSQTRVGYRAVIDGDLVARLKAIGAIPLLVSTTPELCLDLQCNNLITGTTNNPYDTTYTSAGSSGGEGALLGSGASVIGIGSDIAGSIRLPASFNGVYGHKPSPNITPIKGHFPHSNDENFANFLSLGPLTRYAQDLKLLTKIMVGKKIDELRLNEQVDIDKLNVFYIEDTGFSLVLPTVQNEIKEAIKTSVKYLETNCGANVINGNIFRDYFRYANEICGSKLYSIKDVPDLLKAENKSLGVELIKALMKQSQFSLSFLYFLSIQKIFQNCVGTYPTEFLEMKKSFSDQLSDNGILICPTWNTVGMKHHEIYFNMASIMYLLIASAFGLPATSVPCGLNKNGMPIGIQIIAGPNQDRLCLAVAEALDKKYGGWVPPS